MESYLWMIDWLPGESDWGLLICLVTAVTSLPLALRLVPPNCVYGLRTRHTRSGRDAWYDANAFTGRAMLAASIGSAFLLLAGPASLADGWGPALIVFVPMALATLAGFVYMRHVRETAQRR
jgi:uncharacterized membrane protein